MPSMNMMKWICVKKKDSLEFKSVHLEYKSNQVGDEEKHVECHLCVEDEEGNHQNINGNANAAGPTSSFIQSVINLTGMIIGMGQLAAPYGLESAGWMSIFLFIGLGVTCAYSACLLGKCLEKNPNLRSYIGIGEATFGKRGKVLVAVFVYMEVFMTLVSYTISLHANLNAFLSISRVTLTPHDLYMGLPKSYIFTIIAVLITIPTLWLRNLSAISYMSTAGILMSLAIFVAVMSTMIFGFVKADKYIPTLHLHNIPRVSGLYIFCFGGHVVVPNLYKDMKDPSKFTKVAMVSFTATTLYYTTMAFIGAKMFGESVKSQITLSMPKDLIFTKIALWATILTPMTKYALEFAPIAIQIEQNLPSYIKSRTKLFIRGSIGPILILAILAIALSVPYFEYVLSLTGSLVNVIVNVILPCIFYTKICLTHQDVSKPLITSFNAILVAIAATIGVFGTISSLKSIIDIFVTNIHHPI